MKLYYLFAHLVTFLSLSLLPSVDYMNLFLSLSLSYLILRQIAVDECAYLSFNKIFLFGAYYYLVIFPLFYSLGLIESLTFDPVDLTLACIASLIGVLGYSLGRFIVLSNGESNYRKTIDINSLSKGFYSKKTDGLIFLLFLFVLLGMSILESSFRAFLFLPFTALFILFAFKFIRDKTSRNICLIIGIILILIYVALVSTSRLELIKVALLSAFLVSFLGNIKVNFRKIFFYGSFVFLGAIYITVFRTWALEDLGAKNIFEAYLAIFERNKGLIGLLVRLGDIGIGYDNLIYIIKNTDFSSLLLGSTLIRPLLIFIPRAIWSSKPTDTQLLIVEERYGALSEYGGGTSQSITLVGDFFWNYSYFGVLLGFIFFGLLTTWFDKKLIRSRSISTILVLSIFTPFFFIAWRGSYSSQLIYTLFSIIPVLGVIFLHKILKELPVLPKK